MRRLNNEGQDASVTAAEGAMGWTWDRVCEIYYTTDGYCHLCEKKLSLQNYGRYGAKGAWHVDHVIPRTFGGDDGPRNLRPACIECNSAKGVETKQQLFVQNALTRSRAQSASSNETRTRRGSMMEVARRALIEAGYSASDVKTIRFEAVRVTMQLRKPKR